MNANNYFDKEQRFTNISCHLYLLYHTHLKMIRYLTHILYRQVKLLLYTLCLQVKTMHVINMSLSWLHILGNCYFHSEKKYIKNFKDTFDDLISKFLLSLILLQKEIIKAALSFVFDWKRIYMSKTSNHTAIEYVTSITPAVMVSTFQTSSIPAVFSAVLFVPKTIYTFFALTFLVIIGMNFFFLWILSMCKLRRITH